MMHRLKNLIQTEKKQGRLLKDLMNFLLEYLDLVEVFFSKDSECHRWIFGRMEVTETEYTVNLIPNGQNIYG